MRKPNRIRFSPGNRIRTFKAFTLIELLVVIAIISLLISILMPTLSKAKRMALVLACPVAYIASDRTVWITHPTQGYHLQVCDEPALEENIRWSPRGNRISFRGTYGDCLIVADPLTGESEIHDYLTWHTWVSDDEIAGCKYIGGQCELWRLDVESGKSWFWKDRRAMNLPYGQVMIHYDPLLTDGFITCEADRMSAPQFDIYMRSADWGHGVVIHEDPGNNIEDYNPHPDRLGEYVAWTRGRRPGIGGPWCVAIKPIHDSAGTPPLLLGQNYDNVTFCDWASDGNLLVIVTEHGVQALCIMDLRGAVVRKIETPRGIIRDPGSVATWRRYEHW